MSEIRPGDIARLDQAMASADAALIEWVSRYQTLVQERGRTLAAGAIAMELVGSPGASPEGQMGLLLAAIRRLGRQAEKT